MNRLATNSLPRLTSVPRSRGDEPEDVIQVRCTMGRSPLARG